MVVLRYSSAARNGLRPSSCEMPSAPRRRGFEFAAISEHYHPWIDAQGKSSFVRAVLGAIAASTNTLRAGTAVTCPIQRIHPVLVAQAAATAAELFDGRFFLGLGSGENLNEHTSWENIGRAPNSAGRCSSRLLGEGNRLFDQMGPEPIELADRLESARVIESPVVTHFRFRFVQ